MKPTKELQSSWVGDDLFTTGRWATKRIEWQLWRSSGHWRYINIKKIWTLDIEGWTYYAKEQENIEQIM